MKRIPGTRKTAAALFAAALLAACGGLEETSPMPEHDLKADLATLAASRTYFGHQSVGRDLLEGLEVLAKEHGVSLRIAEGPAPDTLPGIVHTKVGRNREPGSKCKAFGKFLADHKASGGRPWDAAAFKFCYVDLGDEAGRDPAKLLEMYKAAVASVRAADPGLNLVHVTIPLKSDNLGLASTVKRVLGLGTDNDADNVLRNAFNDLLRAEYAKEPLFDLARAESTLPSGKRTGFQHEGKTVYTLAKEFTYDEGHLTSEGKKRVAAEFARAMAAAIRSKPSPAPAAVASAPADSAAAGIPAP